MINKENYRPLIDIDWGMIFLLALFAYLSFWPWYMAKERDRTETERVGLCMEHDIPASECRHWFEGYENEDFSTD